MKEKKVKIITFYLPQFHEIPENNKWWGKGFTEWVNVKKAKPLFSEHYQPRIPLNNNYYSLDDEKEILSQTKLAEKYGVYGFCFYHYWFSGKLLLEKPLEIFNESKSINFPFCISWANERWTNAWSADGEPKILIDQKYGSKEDWEKHFRYLLQFFKNENYIKEDNKPLFIIYRPELIDCLDDMLELFENLAKQEGFSGMVFAYQHLHFDKIKNKNDSMFKYSIEYQPAYAVADYNSKRFGEKSNRLISTVRKLIKPIEDYFKISILENIRPNSLRIYSYDDLWKEILTREPRNEKSVPGAFVDWDNTPRRGLKGWLVSGVTPEKFEKYLEIQVNRTIEVYNKDYLFLFAWNEWAEGGYLEPDEKNEYKYLESISKAVK